LFAYFSFGLEQVYEDRYRKKDEPLNIYKMFLLGSENLNETLTVTDRRQLRAIDEVLEEDSSCLNKLKKLEIDLDAIKDYYDDDDEQDHIIKRLIDFIPEVT